MGSRTKPNLGGSGAPKTRKDWVIHKHNPRSLLSSGVFVLREDIDLYLSTTLIMCLECGQDCRSLGHHLSKTHSMSSKEYKIKYNIPLGLSLRCESSIKLSSDGMKEAWKSDPNAEERRKAQSNFAKNTLVGIGHIAPRTATFEKQVHSKPCLTCGKVFETINKYELSKRKYCSKKCHTDSEEEQKKLKINAAKAGAKRSATGKKDSLGRFV